MATTASSDTSERFMLDAASFEKFLAAAWVLQCQHDEALLNLQRTLRKTNAVSSSIQKTEPALELQPSTNAATRCLTILPDIEDKLEMPQRQPGMEPVRIELKPLDLKLHEHHENASVPQAVDGEAIRETLRANENEAVAKLESSVDLRASFSKLYRAFNNYQRTFRVNLPQPAIRSVAIAAPILGLAILSGLLLIATWRHEPAHNAQISQPSAAPADGTVTGGSLLPGTTAQNASQDFGTASSPASDQLRSVSSLQMSHLRVTDPGTASVVRELSAHEIRGLRHRARYGDASAAFSLGMAYETGRHLHQSCVEAAHWVAKSAAAGNAAAQYNLGLRYQTGDGVHANPAQSRKWLRKAARRDPNAKLALKLLASR
jgi:Sel1 repeat-containing protein